MGVVQARRLLQNSCTGHNTLFHCTFGLVDVTGSKQPGQHKPLAYTSYTNYCSPFSRLVNQQKIKPTFQVLEGLLRLLAYRITGVPEKVRAPAPMQETQGIVEMKRRRLPCRSFSKGFEGSECKLCAGFAALGFGFRGAKAFHSQKCSRVQGWS